MTMSPSTTKSANAETRTFTAMGNSATISVVAESASVIDDALTAGIQRVHELESRWSRFIAESEISRYNETGDTSQLSIDSRRLLAHCEASRQQTGQLFDARVVATMLDLGYDRSLVAPRIGTRAGHAGAIDPGAIGKGLAADLVCDMLREFGVLGGLVSLGGDLRCFGSGDRNGRWLVDVAAPTDSLKSIARVHLADGGVATSNLGAKRWSALPVSASHVIDPRTMTSIDPTRHHIVQATVIASTAAWAETFATAALIDSTAAAVAMIDRNDVAGLLVAGDGRVVRTSNWRHFE